MDEMCERHGGVALFETSSAEDPESVGAVFAAALREGLASKVGGWVGGSLGISVCNDKKRAVALHTCGVKAQFHLTYRLG